MAEMRLQGHSDQVENDLEKTEASKLDELGHDRSHYEKLVEELNQKTSS